MRLGDLLKVIPEITSVRIKIYSMRFDKAYLFTSKIEKFLNDYVVTCVSTDYTRRYRMLIILEVPDEEH